MARYSVTSEVFLWVIFSTPATMTVSYSPLMTANIPVLSATADELHAASVLIDGIGVSPAQSAIVGPVCPWCSKDSPICPTNSAWMSLFGSRLGHF